MKRVDVRELLLGKGSYFDDLDYQGFHASIVRSPYAHAKILRVDTSKAESAGDSNVLTGEIIRKFTKSQALDQKEEGAGLASPALAVDKVRYQGEPVALVVARDPYSARDIADLVEVEYEPLKAVTSIDEALEGKNLIFESLGSNVVSSKTFEYGDTSYFSRVNNPLRLLEVNLYWSRSLGNPIETFGVTAIPDADNGKGLTIISNAQAVQLLADTVSKSLGVPIRMVPTRQGGSFGAKFSLLKYMAIIGFAALYFRTPVKWVETRTEHLLASNSSGPERKFRIKAYFKDDGEVVAMDSSVWEDVGGDTGGGRQALKALNILSGPYNIRNLRYSAMAVATNKNPSGAFRGAGTPPQSWCLERLMDAVADELHISSEDVRRKNLISEFPHDMPFSYIDSGNPMGLLEMALSRKDLFSMRSAKDRIGVGIACSTDPSTPSHAFTGRGEGVKMSIKNGKVVIGLGYSPEGQGNEHTAVMLASRLLQIPVDDITFEILSSSQGPPPAFGPGGSKMAVYTAGSVSGVVEKMKSTAVQRASEELGGERVEYQNGWLVSDSDKRVKLTELEGLQAEYVFYQEGKSNFVTFPFACDVAVVQITEAGKIIPLKQVVYIDCGTPLDEELVKEQVQGGTSTGISLALYENSLYDADGNLLAATLGDYGFPSAQDVPVDIEVNIVPTPSKSTPMGAKGIGEIPVGVAAAAVCRAVEDALGYSKKIDRIPISLD
jgi:aerobic carbon-monoxide dehydrogenase large subunit